MTGCHKSGPASRRPFVITPYSTGPSGALEPAIPQAGPCFVPDRKACVLRVDHLRRRKTGPCFPLMVLTCKTHRLGFTLYPPGHVPYGRVRVAPVAPDGAAIVGGPGGAEAFAETVFAAALDASQQKAWDREQAGGSERWWGTQWRNLDVALQICGVTPGLGAAEREAMAATLDVTMMLLREQAWGIASAPGYHRRGQAVHAVLDALAGGRCVLARLMASGHLAGLWGPPLLWDTQTARLRSLSFRGL